MVDDGSTGQRAAWRDGKVGQIGLDGVNPGGQRGRMVAGNSPHAESSRGRSSSTTARPTRPIPATMCRLGNGCHCGILVPWARWLTSIPSPVRTRPRVQGRLVRMTSWSCSDAEEEVDSMPPPGTAGLRPGRRGDAVGAARRAGRRAPELHDVGVVHLHCEGPGPHLAPEMAGHFRHRALFIGPNARAAVNEGRADYVPVFLSDIPQLFARGSLPLDAALDQRDAARRARVLLARDVSVDATLAAVASRADRDRPAQPRHAAHAGRRASSTSTSIDLGVEVDVPPYEHARRPIGEVERRIGEHVAELVPDGATLQMGIGAIPAAVALRPARQARPRHPHRDVHRRRWSTWSSRASSRARARRSTAARS